MYRGIILRHALGSIHLLFAELHIWYYLNPLLLVKQSDHEIYNRLDLYIMDLRCLIRAYGLMTTIGSYWHTQIWA